MHRLSKDELFLILILLTPEEALLVASVSKAFRSAVMSDSFWFKKLQQHYPFQSLELGERIIGNSYSYFKSMYLFTGLTTQQRLKFTLVKENRLDKLIEIITPEDVVLQEKNTQSDLLTYAQFDKSKSLINYFFATFVYDYDPNLQLIWALRCHQPLAVIRDIVASGAQVNPISNHGFLPIHCVAASGDIAVFNFLVQTGADPTVLCAGRSMLHLAVIYDNPAIIPVLVSAGVKIDARDIYHDEPLRCDIKLNRRQAVEQLLSLLKDNIDPLDVSLAIRVNPEIVPLLLSRVKLQDPNLYKYLADAMSLERMALIEFLMLYDVDIHKALVLAVSRSLKVVEYLVARGADLSVVDNVQTLLHKAVGARKAEIIAYLCDKGVRVNERDKDGNTAMHLAAKLSHDESDMVLLLYRKGAQADIENHNGQTVKQIAVEKNLIMLVETFNPGFYKQRSKAIPIKRLDGSIVLPNQVPLNQRKFL